MEDEDQPGIWQWFLSGYPWLPLNVSGTMLKCSCPVYFSPGLLKNLSAFRCVGYTTPDNVGQQFFFVKADVLYHYYHLQRTEQHMYSYAENEVR